MATKLSNTPGASAMPQAAAVGTAIDGTEVHLDDVNAPALQLPTIPPNTPFLIAVHPNHWHINNGFLVPSFKMIPVKAGVEGAKVSGNGIDMSKPKQVAAAKGFTIIPTSAGPGGRSYLRAHRVVGGTAYLTAWDTARSGEAASEFDAQAFHDWVWDLVARGVLPPPSVLGLRRERKSIADVHMKDANQSKVSVEAEARAQVSASALKAIDKRIAQLTKAKPAIRPDQAQDVSIES